MSQAVILGDGPLTLEQLVAVARDGARVELAAGVADRMASSREWVEHALTDRGADGRIAPIYSINTGFGSLAGREAFQDPSQAADLSRRLIVSNASGVGAFLPHDVVRAAMLIRISSLLRGYSGVRVAVVQVLLDMLNAGVVPAVPEYGSLGASGDLVPLAHIMLVASRPAGDEDPEIDSGEAFAIGRAAGSDGATGAPVISGIAAMRAAGLERIVLQAKEGLALTNGTSFSTALAALALVDAETVLETAEVGAAMSIEALLGFGDAFLPQIHEARGQAGQIASAAHLRELLRGSDFVDGSETVDPLRQPPQDAYALRCIPQVHGAVRDTLAFARGIVETELNAATDNPLIFADLPDSRSLKAVSGGNFHAEYLAFVSDFLAVAVTEIGSICERRVARLVDGKLNRGLPEMLVDSEDVGMDCGYMLPQYVAAGLVSDCKTLAHPDSVDSIPTSANQEDHVSMAANAGRHARQVVENIAAVVGIELVMAAQAVDLRLQQPEHRGQAMAACTRAAYELIRSTRTEDGRTIDYLARDVVLYPRLRAATNVVISGAALRAALPASHQPS